MRVCGVFSASRCLDPRCAGWVVLLLVWFALVGGCTSKEDKVLSFLKKGDALAAAGDVQRAVIEYRNALQLDPKNVRAMLGLGKAYERAQEYSKAYGIFRGVLELQPDMDEARLHVISLLVLGGEPRMALQELSAVVDPAGNEPLYSLSRGRVLAALEQYTQAREVLQNMAGWRESREALAVLALCAREMGDMAGMEGFLKQWRVLSPEDPSSYLFAAQCALDWGDKARAAEELRQMADASPSNVHLAVMRAQTLESLGMMEEARSAFNDLPADGHAQRARAGFLLKRGEHPEARAVLEGLLQKDPSDVEGLLMLVNVMNDAGERAQAVERLDAALKGALQGEDREKAILAKAVIRSQMGEWASARDLCEEVLKSNQGNMDAHLILGKILLNSGLIQEAAVHLGQVALDRPDDGETQILLARSQHLAKKDALAEDTLKRAVKTCRENKNVILELTRLYVGRNDRNAAVSVLKEGLGLYPDDAQLLGILGDVQLAGGDHVAAEASYRRLMEKSSNPLAGQLGMGRVMLARSKPQDAIDWYREAMKQEEGWQAALPALIATWLKQGSTREALQVARSEADKRPQSPLAQYYLGQVLLELGDLKGGEEALARASELAPTWVDPYLGLVEVHMRRGESGNAIDKLRAVYEAKPSISSGMRLAVLMERTGRHRDAVPVYDDLLERYGQNPMVMNNLAYLYAEHAEGPEDLQKASRLIRLALAQEPDNANFVDTLAWVNFKEGELDTAWSNFERAVAMDPEVGVFYLHGALIAQKRQDREACRELLAQALGRELDPFSLEKASALKESLGSE